MGYHISVVSLLFMTEAVNRDRATPIASLRGNTQGNTVYSIACTACTAYNEVRRLPRANEILPSFDILSVPVCHCTLVTA